MEQQNLAVLCETANLALCLQLPTRADPFVYTGSKKRQAVYDTFGDVALIYKSVFTTSQRTDHYY